MTQDMTRRTALGAAGAGGVALLFAGTGARLLDALRPGVAEAAAAACTLTPAKTEGPYFVDEKLNRSDIRSNTGDGAVQDGAPLTLSLQVFDANQDCAPVQGAKVDIWHANAAGRYSDETANGTSGENWLRGYQTTDANGLVTFTTIYPGWYTGRTVHIHFKVRFSGFEFTSQLFFTDAMNKSVFTSRSPYNDRSPQLPDTDDESDGIYGSDGASLLLSPTADGNGYRAEFSIGLSQGASAPSQTGSSSVQATLNRVRMSATRRLELTLKVKEAVSVDAKVTRSGHTLARRRTSLSTGTRTVTLAIPATVKAGAARLVLKLTDADGHAKTYHRTLHVASR